MTDKIEFMVGRKKERSCFFVFFDSEEISFSDFRRWFIYENKAYIFVFEYQH